MKRLQLVAALTAWTIVVCLGTFRLTFPSQVVIDRIRYEVPERVGRSYTADIGSAAPWWLGVSLDDVKLFHIDGPTRFSTPVKGGEEEADEEPPEPETGPRLVAALDNLSLRVSPWSLLWRAPYVTTSLSFGDQELVARVATAAGEHGDLHLQDLGVDGEVPLQELLAMMAESAAGNGVIAVNMDLDGGEVGIRDASGRISIKSEKLAITEMELPGVGPLGMEIPISELTLVMDVVNGKATVTDGRMVSDLATIAISGDVTLRDPVDRSSYDLQFVVSNLSSQLTAFSGLMSGAKQSDGTFLYSCHGTVSRPSARDCSSRPRSARAAPPSRPGDLPTAPGVPGVPPPVSSMPAPRAPLTEDEREKKRQEIRDRLRRGREDRRVGGATPSTASGGPTGPEPAPEDEIIPVEEPPPDEEPPPPDDEEPVE